MSDGSLSQDEIDALLQGGDMDGLMSTPAPAPAGGGSSALSDSEINDFKNIISELLPVQAQNLSNMVGDSVDMKEPSVEVVNRDSFVNALAEDVVEIVLNFQDQLSGSHSYVIGPEAATTIASLMMGQEDLELNDAALSAIEEAANTLAGTAATTFGDKSGKSMMTSPGDTKKISRNDFSFPSDEIVKVSYKTKIDGKEPTEFNEAFDVNLVKAILGGVSGAGAADLSAMGAAPAADPFAGMGNMGNMAGMGASAPQPMGGMGGMDMFGGPSNPNIQGVQFPNLNPQGAAAEQGNIGLLMDVSMEMTVELGRTRKLIKEILGMGEGTIIELDKLAGEPVDILVNHKLIAKGEVVVIDENFGVRVTEIVSPMDRVDSL
ncbi:MAG: flagellar motor switch phosphatase FliY [Spirochaetales bacterium]|nr:flagellar motor switch phosphatase FliY [Spirochaetales bacterium]